MSDEPFEIVQERTWLHASCGKFAGFSSLVVLVGLLAIVAAAPEIAAAKSPARAGFWESGGSTVSLEASGAKRSFLVEAPSAELSRIGARKGTLLFVGRRSGEKYEGKAYSFSKGCKPAPYTVTGDVSNSDRLVILSGKAPVLDKDCGITGRREQRTTFIYHDQEDDWGAASVTIAPSLREGNIEFTDVAFSPNGKLLLTNDFTDVRLWEVASGLPLRTLTQPEFFTASLFSPDGKLIVSAHKDGTIRLWNVATGRVLAELRHKAAAGSDELFDEISSLWIDPRGELLVAGDIAGVVRIWNLGERRVILSVKLPALDKLGNSPRVVLARLSADRRRLIVLARKGYRAPDSAAIFDAHSGTNLSSFDLPPEYKFVRDGYVADAEAIVRVSSKDCPTTELALFSLSYRKKVAGILKPKRCSKDGDSSKSVKVFSSPDSTRIAVTWEGESGVFLWDAQARQLERHVQWSDAGAANIIGLSRDFTRVATQDAGRIRIRAFDTGAPIKDFANFGVGARYVVASITGSHILLEHDFTGKQGPVDVDVRALDTLKPASARLAKASDLTVYAFAPLTNLALAANSNGEALLLSLKGGGEPRKISIPALKSIFRAQMSPDGKSALVLGEAAKESSDFVVYVAALLDTTDGKVTHSFQARDDDGYLSGIAFSPDGTRFAIGHRSGTVEIWDAKSVKLLKTLSRPGDENDDADTRTLKFSSDGRLLIGSGLFFDKVFIWNIASGKVVRIYDLGPRVCGYRYATAVALSHDGKTLAAGLGQRAVSSGDNGAERGNVVVWNAHDGKRLFTLRGQRGAISALTFSPDDRWIVSGSFDGTIKYWDRTSGALMATAMGGADGSWLVLTRAGFYAGSAEAGAAIAVVRGNEAVPASLVRGELLRPDLAQQLLRGDPSGRYGAAARRLNLPEALGSSAH